MKTFKNLALIVIVAVITFSFTKVNGQQKEIKSENSKFGDFIEYVHDRPFNDKRYYISNKKLKEVPFNSPRLTFFVPSA